MSYVKNEGVNIYYEQEGEGYPLFIHHGMGGSIKSWRDAGYIAPLAEKYRLVMMHARGHGKSDHPHIPEAYSNRLMAGDVLTVLDDLDIKLTHFYGYSMGGRVGLALCKYAPERFSSMVIGGMGLGERDSKYIEERRDRVEVMRKGFDAFVSSYEENRGSKLTEKELEEWRMVDLGTLAALMSLEDLMGYHDYLPEVDIPTLFYAGPEDSSYASAQEGAEMMPNAKFVTIPGVDHESGFERSDLILPHVLQFLAEQR